MLNLRAEFGHICPLQHHILKNKNSRELPAQIIMTFAVEWALKPNYLLYPSTSIRHKTANTGLQQGPLITEAAPMSSTDVNQDRGDNTR